MTTTFLQTLMIALAASTWGASSGFAADTQVLVDDTVVFAEKDGLVAVEAEHYFEQSKTDVRAFYLQTDASPAQVQPDGDPLHTAGASGGAYLEILPDTRRTHADKLIRHTNFSPNPGRMAILSYKVRIETPGRYYVWVRAFSTGSEDNGLHVGLDNEWPQSGQRLQWCQGKNTWRWESRQRTEAQHCGEPHKIYLDIKTPGIHTIHFSMREDGFEFDRWLMTTDRGFNRPDGFGPQTKLAAGKLPKPFPVTSLAAKSAEAPGSSPTTPVSSLPLQRPRGVDGDGTVRVSGEAQTWHKITLTLDGPFAHEQDNTPNPFTDYCMTVDFTHADGTRYLVPGYFAADGNAAETSARAGTAWRVHFAPDRSGPWNYRVHFRMGPNAALTPTNPGGPVAPYDGLTGTVNVTKSDKTGRDFRAHGRLNYVGKHYLRFAGSGEWFLKAGADAPETLLAFRDFDNTIAGKPQRAPLKSWAPHIQDWNDGDPQWQGTKGRGLIGAVNYLSSKGCNAFSFLTYNAGGDGDNVWPFIHRDDKLHYDCSKLDQWGIVFDHGTAKGMYLHFKMQETENDDHNKGPKGKGFVPESLDGGNLGPQRRLYCRELIARFGHNLALNWNLGEENTQTHAQQQAMTNYIVDLDPYDHPIVIHTYPEQQAKVYEPKLGEASRLTGVSLQNSSLRTTHEQTKLWVRASADSGRPWVVAFDESGSAAHGQCPDLGYRGFDGHDRTGKLAYTEHEVRKQTLWGTLMAGGAGCEYYFGYQFAENDIVCEDWRSRDRSWDYCRIAIGFFRDNQIPFWEMQSADFLVGNTTNSVERFCFAKPHEIYVVYLANGGTTDLDLSETEGPYDVTWFDPRNGGALQKMAVQTVSGGKPATIGPPPSAASDDWVAIIRRADNAE